VVILYLIRCDVFLDGSICVVCIELSLRSLDSFLIKKRKEGISGVGYKQNKNDHYAGHGTGRLPPSISSPPASHMLARWRLSLYICSSSGATRQSRTLLTHHLHRLHATQIWQSNRCTIKISIYVHTTSTLYRVSKARKKTAVHGSTLRVHFARKVHNPFCSFQHTLAIPRVAHKENRNNLQKTSRCRQAQVDRQVHVEGRVQKLHVVCDLAWSLMPLLP
jgi:hypothetical protein